VTGVGDAQRAWALAQVKPPVSDPERFARVLATVTALDGAYAMTP
jgi:hypothetical protein